MLKVSSGFRRAIASGAEQKVKVEMTLKNGTSLTLDGGDFVMGGVSFTKSSSSNGTFDIGSAVIGTCTLTLANHDGRWDSYRFDGARAKVRIGVKVGDSNEWVLVGKYYVEAPESYGATIDLKCYDHMSKFEKKYKKVKTTYPANLKKIVTDICETCGVPLATKTFPNCKYRVKRRPKTAGLTCIEMIGFVAQIAGCFADMSADGELRIRWYEKAAFETEDTHDGRTSSVDGNSSSGKGGTFSKSKKKSITAIRNLQVNIDPKTVTGLQVQASWDEKTFTDGETTLYGSDGYVLKISGNPLVEYGRASEVASMVGSSRSGLEFRPLSTQSLADPTIEAGDVISVTDAQGRTYQTCATQVQYSSSGMGSLSCNAQKTSEYEEVKRRSTKKKEIDDVDEKVQMVPQMIEDYVKEYMKHSDYEAGSYDPGSYDPGGYYPDDYYPSGGGWGDGWTHQIDGVTQQYGTINFVTVPNNSYSGNSGSSDSGSSDSGGSSGSNEGWGGGDGTNPSSSGGGDF